jgi:MFS family permease
VGQAKANRLIKPAVKPEAQLVAEGRFAALQAPLYRRYWLGSIGSVGATQLVMMGQAWLVFELSASAADLAILGAAASLPTIIMVFFGGVVADRFDRRRIMMITTPVSAALLAMLAGLDFTNTVQVWHVWLLAGLFATVSGFDWPAWQSIFPLLIERKQMMSAVSLNAMLWQGTRMMMPGIGGFIIAAFTTAAVFGVGAVGFLAMFFVIASLPVRAAPASSGISAGRAVLEGFAFVRQNQLFAVLIPLTYVMMFFGTSYLQIMPLFADRLGVGAEAYGVLMSASGLGAVAGTLLTASLQGSRRLGRIMLLSAIAAAAVQLVFSAVAYWHAQSDWAYVVMCACVTFTAASGSVFLITSMSAMQLHVPDALRGRVMSLHGISFSLIALGALFSGGIAEVRDAPTAVTVGAIVVIAATTLVWFKKPGIRDITGE